MFRNLLRKKQEKAKTFSASQKALHGESKMSAFSLMINAGNRDFEFCAGFNLIG